MGYAERVGFIERKNIITRDEQGQLQIDEVALSERTLQARQVANYYGLPQPKNAVFRRDKTVSPGFR